LGDLGGLKNLFAAQITEWNLAQRNYASLANVLTKTVDFEGFSVQIQFNPARITSSAAKVDTASIAERPCFLCAKNRPEVQRFIACDDYEILVNPFPIFPQHFTIAHKNHIPQRIEPFFADLLYFAQKMSDFIVFFNAAGCGASAPDHLHFQAGTKDFLPLIADYRNLKEKNAVLLKSGDGFEIFELKNYLRTVFCIEASTADATKSAFEFLSAGADLQSAPLKSAKINIVANYENGKYYVFVFPRKAFRPVQYFAENEAYRILVSPATVEMSGILITPLRQDFEKITKEDIVSIYQQVSGSEID
jgi:ATP adenylyltransferase/5',5'''-P-1,P-4-tetraphosphate phosphorylase II